jgi:hypothetical protein
MTVTSQVLVHRGEANPIVAHLLSIGAFTAEVEQGRGHGLASWKCRSERHQCGIDVVAGVP